MAHRLGARQLQAADVHDACRMRLGKHVGASGEQHGQARDHRGTIAVKLTHRKPEFVRDLFMRLAAHVAAQKDVAVAPAEMHRKGAQPAAQPPGRDMLGGGQPDERICGEQSGLVEVAQEVAARPYGLLDIGSATQGKTSRRMPRVNAPCECPVRMITPATLNCFVLPKYLILV